MKASNDSLSPSFSTFLSISDAEYEALSKYCNSLSQLTYAIHAPNERSAKETSVSSFEGGGAGGGTSVVNDQDNNIQKDIKYNTMMMNPSLFISKSNKKSSSANTSSPDVCLSALLEYQNTLQLLRTKHMELVECYDILSKHYDRQQRERHDQQENMIQIKNHIQLSERVLKTCASSSTVGYGPFHENGLLKNLGGGGIGTSPSDSEDPRNEDWHEIRIVALTSLKASITRIRRICVESGNE
mmetsp:Transcript_17071/g.19744  ORF Transcript_17071/g.19744 Transcript_17071/m.19744 type:complete len:242 (+) Transcript_17071:28-753(+)